MNDTLGLKTDLAQVNICHSQSSLSNETKPSFIYKPNKCAGVYSFSIDTMKIPIPQIHFIKNYIQQVSYRNTQSWNRLLTANTDT